MASGGMYDHIGGGFARYSVDRAVARAPLREDALRPGAARARRTCTRLVVIGAPQWRQVVEETIELRAHATCAIPTAASTRAEDADSPDEHGHGHEGLFHTWTPDEVRAALLGDDRRRRAGARVVRASPTERQLPKDGRSRSRPGCTHRGELIASARRSRRARRGCSPTPARRAPRPVSTTRCSPSGTRCSCRRWPRPQPCSTRADWLAAAIANAEFLLARTARRRTVAGTASWHADGEPHGAPRRARRRPRRARRRVHPTRRAHRARPAGSTRRVRDRRHDARLVLGPGPRRPVHDRRGRRGTRRAPEGPVATTPRRRRTRWPRMALYRLAALTGEQRYANHADRILQLLERSCSTRPSGGFSQRAARARTCATAASPRSRSSATDPTWCASPTSIWRPDMRAGVGRAVRLAVVGRARRRLRIRLPGPRLPDAAGHDRGIRRSADRPAGSADAGDRRRPVRRQRRATSDRGG